MHDSLEAFLAKLKARNLAEGTEQQYTGGLRTYSEWLELEGIEPEKASTRDIQGYLAWLVNDREYAPKTVRGYFTPVSQYYADLEAVGELEEDPTEPVTITDYASKETRREQITKQRRVWLTEDEISELVEHAPGPKVRNRLLILFMYFTGLRRQEVVDVKLEDLDREERQVQVRGKGNKLHTAHWNPRMDGLLMQWLDGGYRDASPYAAESEYLFLSERSPKLDGSTLNSVVKQAAENAGLQEKLYEDRRGYSHWKVTSHVLRHSYAVHWLENGGSIEALSESMAHSSDVVTEVYGEISDDRVSEEYEKYGPDIELDL